MTWLEIPVGAEQTLRSHEEAEQVYVVVRGAGTMSVAGDTQRVAEGDLILVPPATDHSIANDGDAELACVSVQSPPVAAAELYSDQMAEVAATTTTDSVARNRLIVRATRAPASVHGFGLDARAEQIAGARLRRPRRGAAAARGAGDPGRGGGGAGCRRGARLERGGRRRLHPDSGGRAATSSST